MPFEIFGAQEQEKSIKQTLPVNEHRQSSTRSDDINSSAQLHLID
jgi:hypothetical protein